MRIMVIDSKKQLILLLLILIIKIEYAMKPGITIMLEGCANTDIPRNRPASPAKKIRLLFRLADK